MKINLNKICFTLSLALLLATFFLGENAKAVTIGNLPIDANGYVTIPSHDENTLLVCHGIGDSGARSHFGWDWDSMTFNDVVMTKIPNFSFGAYGAVFFTINPLIGAHRIADNSGRGNFSVGTFCAFVSDIDASDPFVAYSTGGTTDFSGTYYNGIPGNMVINYFENYENSSATITSSNSTMLGYASFVGNDYHKGASSYQQITSISQAFTYSGFTANGSMGYIEFRGLVIPPCQSYNYGSWSACDETGRQTRGILSSVPTVCSYTDVQSVAPILGQDCNYTAPVYPDVSLPFTIISPFTFSFNSTAKVNYTYDTNTFTPYDYIEVRQVSSDWATSTLISTSSPVANDFLHNGHSYFLLPGNPEVRGRYNYEVTGYFAPYYLPGVGDVPATSSITVVFSVYWRETEVPTAQDIIDYEHTLSTEFSHGVLYETSCTNEEWATPDPQVDFGFGVWTFPALNMTRLHCAAELAALELSTAVIDKMTGYFTKVSNMLKNVFPFNIYSNLSESWINSKYTEVLPELSFLSPVNGNLSVQIPNGTVGSSTSFVLWGSGIFTSPTTLGTDNANKASQLFGAIRTIIKWALWGLFGFWVVRNGQAFVRKMTGGE